MNIAQNPHVRFGLAYFFPNTMEYSGAQGGLRFSTYGKILKIDRDLVFRNNAKKMKNFESIKIYENSISRLQIDQKL